MTTIIDFTTGLSAAVSSGKMPATKQSNELANWLLKANLLQLESQAAGSGGKLSEHGEKFLRDLREIIEAYQVTANEKNGDDILQDAIYALSQADRSQFSKDQATQSEPIRDATDFVGALRVAFEAFTGNVNWGGEVAHLARLTGADAAEAVEHTAREAKDNLRERDQKQDQMDVDQDSRAKFENRMDTVKDGGSQVLGAGQTVKRRTQDVNDATISHLDEATYRIAERAQDDPEYRRAHGDDIENQLAEIIGDQDGNIPDALKKLRTVVERFAGGKSLNDVRQTLDDYEGFIRKSMDEPGYIESDEYRQRREQLNNRWKQLKDRNTEEGRKWNTDVERLDRESREFNEAIRKDGSINRLKEAHLKLARDLASAAPTASKFALGQASWLWHDVSDVLLPRLFDLIKQIPLPRTEYVDAETEFVLENMNLESLQILPGHVKITNQTSVDIEAPGPAAGESTKDISTKTRIHFTGVHVQLKQISFYYRDKSANGRTLTGLLDVTIPQKGIDIDVQIGLLPTASGDKQRRKRQGFHRIEHVNVTLDDVTTALSKTNHPIAMTFFKPIFRTRLVSALQTSLEQYVRFSLEALDGFAWNVHQRALVFSDTGAPTVGAYIGGLTSALGRMSREGRMFEGLQATSVGLVKDDPATDTAFAAGAAPQIIDGNKHGPVARGVGVGNQQGTGQNQAAKLQQQGQQAKEKVKGEGVPDPVESFVDAVARKRDAEKKSEGWRSSAFDPPASARQSKV
ncbi:hypothetical protein BKA62DRAFT_722425 [Auriculariales sp. MPI-PUGE-AT-0066]|nr:hypothetical protein BKA62DRAFT_722425 [Auriculariales sp. MPI-PUGE-AT-0066]